VDSGLLKELGYATMTVPSIWYDNLSATFLAVNPVFHARMKHIELDYHFIWEKLAVKQLSVKFICSADQIADVFTKSLSRSRFQSLRSKLTICSTMLILRGRVETQELNTFSIEDNGNIVEDS
jgi:hypothetical protein